MQRCLSALAQSLESSDTLTVILCPRPQRIKCCTNIANSRNGQTASCTQNSDPLMWWIVLENICSVFSLHKRKKPLLPGSGQFARDRQGGLNKKGGASTPPPLCFVPEMHDLFQIIFGVGGGILCCRSTVVKWPKAHTPSQGFSLCLVSTSCHVYCGTAPWQRQSPPEKKWVAG